MMVAGTKVASIPDDKGFVRLSREWRSGDTVVLTLPAEIRATKRLTFGDGTEGKRLNPAAPWGGQNSTSNLPFCVIERGSLTFALPMEKSTEFGYAVDCDAATMRMKAPAAPLKQPWDWPLDAPLKIMARARRFHWADAWRLPDRPVAASETIGPEQDIELVPYGNAKVLKISMFPYLDKPSITV